MLTQCVPADVAIVLLLFSNVFIGLVVDRFQVRGSRGGLYAGATLMVGAQDMEDEKNKDKREFLMQKRIKRFQRIQGVVYVSVACRDPARLHVSLTEHMSPGSSGVSRGLSSTGSTSTASADSKQGPMRLRLVAVQPGVQRRPPRLRGIPANHGRFGARRLQR